MGDLHARVSGYIATMVILIFGVSGVWAQQHPGDSGDGHRYIAPADASQIEYLTNLYRDGDWVGLQARAIEVLSRLQPASTGNNTVPPNPQQHHYIFILVSKTLSDKDELIRFMVHDPTPEAFTSRLPGIKKGCGARAFEILLTTHPGVEFASRYTFDQKDDPLVAEIPTAVGLFTPGLALALYNPENLQVMSDSLRITAVRQLNDLHAVMHEIEIPFDRASIGIENKVVLKDKNEVAVAFGKATNGIEVRTARQSDCAKGLVDAARARFVSQDWSDPKKAYSEAFKAWVESLGEKKCDSEWSSVMATDAALRKAIPDWTTIKGTYKIDNVPPRHVGFGLVTAAMVKVINNRRAKLEENLISSDPLTGVATMVVLNWHPWGFDPRSRDMTAGERWRLFGGAMITPEIGLALGAGWGIMRGLSVNVGWSAMYIDRIRDGDELGQPPSNLDDPFEKGVGIAYFIGLGFNLK